MYSVKNSSRALLAALVPLAAMHAVLLAMALIATQASPPLAGMPTPDNILIYSLGRLAMDGALLFVGHLALRQRAISSRVAYGVMGGVMAASSYAIALRNGFLLFPPNGGTEITSGLLPTAAGSLAGFLYGQFAGLEPVAHLSKISPETETPVASRTFDGPVRVRSSIAAIIIAATIPAALTAILVFGIATLSLSGDGPSVLFVTAIPAQMFLIVLVATILPSAIFILCAHHIARALHRHRGYEYAAIGSLVAGLCAGPLALVMPLTPIFLLVLAVVYGAIMGALYRRFAGIEPVPLPEAVLATDEAALVGADHPSRRQHTVILTNGAAQTRS
jgi:hypothetical protein